MFRKGYFRDSYYVKFFVSFRGVKLIIDRTRCACKPIVSTTNLPFCLKNSMSSQSNKQELKQELLDSQRPRCPRFFWVFFLSMRSQLKTEKNQFLRTQENIFFRFFWQELKEEKSQTPFYVKNQNYQNDIHQIWSSLKFRTKILVFLKKETYMQNGFCQSVL